MALCFLSSQTLQTLRLLGNGELKQVAEIMGKLVETLGLELQVSQSHSAAEIYIGYIG